VYSTQLFANILPAAAIVVSAIIAVASWLVTAHKNQTQLMFQKRFEKRLAMFDDIIAAVVPIIDSTNLGVSIPEQSLSDLQKRLSKANLSVQLYGYKEEQILFEKVIACLITQKDNEHFSVLMNTLTMRVRTKEIKALLDDMQGGPMDIVRLIKKTPRREIELALARAKSIR
jgi:hypothetical protein